VIVGTCTLTPAASTSQLVGAGDRAGGKVGERAVRAAAQAPTAGRGGVKDPRSVPGPILEATRTMKRPVRSPSPQGRLAYGGSTSPMTGFDSVALRTDLLCCRGERL